MRITFDQCDEFVDAWIVGVIEFKRGCWLLDIRMKFGEQRLPRVVVKTFGFHQLPLGCTLRKAADAGTTIAEHRAASTVTIDERREQFATVFGLGGVCQAGLQRRIAFERFLQLLQLGRFERRASSNLSAICESDWKRSDSAKYVSRW